MKDSPLTRTHPASNPPGLRSFLTTATLPQGREGKKSSYLPLPCPEGRGPGGWVQKRTGWVQEGPL